MNYAYDHPVNIRNLMTPEYRKLVAWMRLLVVGAFVAIAGLAGLVNDNHPIEFAALALAGGLLAAGSWVKLRPLLADTAEKTPAAPAAPAARPELATAARHA